MIWYITSFLLIYYTFSVLVRRVESKKFANIFKSILNVDFKLATLMVTTTLCKYIFCDNIQTLFSYSSISWHGDRSPLVPTMMLGSLWIFNIWYQWHFNLSLKDILFRCTEKRFAYSVQNINMPFEIDFNVLLIFLKVKISLC